MARTILHVDMDAFYVSVELLRRPELRGLPVVVGGSSARGVVAAASYEARRHGVFSAMSAVVAARRCPEAIFLPADIAQYVEVSARVKEIFHRFTPLVEPLALDEAFLDVSGARRLWGSGTEIAAQIRTAIATEVGLPCSVGVAANKFLAKLASVEAKPKVAPDGVRPGAGVWVVDSGAEQEFLDPLDIRRIWGVGPATATKLERLGIHRVRDLRATDPRRLRSALGRNLADHLIELCHGRDDRAVVPDRRAKSIGHEDTFAEDLTGAEDLHRELLRLADRVSSRLRHDGRSARTLTLKVKFADFQMVTRSVTTEGPFHDPHRVLEAAEGLLAGIDVSRGVRLLGLSLSNLGDHAQQLSLDLAESPGEAIARGTEDPAGRQGQMHEALDAVRERFGSGAIGPASLRTKVRPPAET